jgi:hypothetical protein
MANCKKEAFSASECALSKKPTLESPSPAPLDLPLAGDQGGRERGDLDASLWHPMVVDGNDEQLVCLLLNPRTWGPFRHRHALPTARALLGTSKPRSGGMRPNHMHCRPRPLRRGLGNRQGPPAGSVRGSAPQIGETPCSGKARSYARGVPNAQPAGSPRGGARSDRHALRTKEAQPYVATH